MAVFQNELLIKYMTEFSSRIVNDSGISSDKYHLGKLILQGLKDDPDFVLQIDGSTGKSETNGSVLRRSIQCAASFRNMGLKAGDVIVLMAPHHLDQAIPFYAALYLGIAIAPIDRTFGVYELKDSLNTNKPKIVFCQNDKVRDVQEAVKLSGVDAKVISFDESEHTLSFTEAMEEYGETIDIDAFKAADFDPEETIAFLISTSGTTGLPKAAIATHKNAVTNGPHTLSFGTRFPSPVKSALLVSPLLWLSSLLHYFLAPVFKYTRVQTSEAITTEHALYLIEKYKPTLLVMSPTMMTSWLKAVDSQNCDFSSFECMLIGGSAVLDNIIEKLRELTPNTQVTIAYGMSELCSMILHGVTTPASSCGIRFSHIQYKLVNIETGEEIKEPYKCGELWMKGPSAFKGYYNNPEATAEAITEDGWFKTGDMMYRDENWRFYFVDRIKLLLKYKNYQISPVELEAVIQQHPGVQDVAVTGIPDVECGDLACACVVPHAGETLTKQEIMDLVKEKLSDAKQLRGGVIFLKELPLTASSKINRRILKEIVVARAIKQLN